MGELDGSRRSFIRQEFERCCTFLQVAIYFPPRPLAAPGGVTWDPEARDVWLVDLDPPAEHLSALQALLSKVEAVRTNRFRFERHRRRFTAARGSLRRVLGAYLGIEAGAVAFEYGTKGKPRLAAGMPHPGLHFNVSHSADRALIAIAGQPLGVDIEQVRSLKFASAIAKRFFSDSEQEAFRTVPDEDKDEAFFRCWTRKEAYVKALGDGLSIPLSNFDVSLERCDRPELRIRGPNSSEDRWCLHHLEPAPEYVGAVAVRDPRCSLRAWTLGTP